ncbi:variable surface protein [Plasmodium gonderi]|uniref:Variable surface protein n=1 Tax=Plasmodium gonderi TaxID=77519 RepID=A0A1Y1JUF4_PLAGO|nr:variable surface protein [Plasmodium gonderi]GAW84033.1 variable surface protein [Plasmodium gonderi]
MTSDTISEDKDFDFNGIFPVCTDGFNWDKEAYRGEPDANKFTSLCSGFYIQESKGNRSTDFSKLCRVLALYLKYIGAKEEYVRKNCCKLFYYKLKKDIIDIFLKNEYPEANVCYQKMIDYRKNGLDIQISNICKDDFVNIDVDSCKIMENLFEIYNYINLFKSNSYQRTTQKMRDFMSCIKKLETHSDKYKNRLKEELDKIIKICVQYRNNWEGWHKSASDLLTESWIEKRRIYFNGEAAKTKSIHVQTQTLESTVFDSQASMSTDTGGETSTGINIGMVFITFSIFIMIIILYKYTPYFSFLKPRVRKIRRRLNKNNKNNLDLMYSFDVEYKNLIHDRYNMAYK